MNIDDEGAEDTETSDTSHLQTISFQQAAGTKRRPEWWEDECQPFTADWENSAKPDVQHTVNEVPSSSRLKKCQTYSSSPQ